MIMFEVADWSASALQTVLGQTQHVKHRMGYILCYDGKHQGEPPAIKKKVFVWGCSGISFSIQYVPGT